MICVNTCGSNCMYLHLLVHLHCVYGYRYICVCVCVLVCTCAFSNLDYVLTDGGVASSDLPPEKN